MSFEKDKELLHIDETNLSIEEREKKSKILKGENEFKLANDYATKSEDSWGTARESFIYLTREQERLKNWNSILSTAPILALSMAFIPVCIAEYFFSKEIYREVSKDWSIVVALAFISIGIVISELMVYRIFAQKRDWKEYELRNQNTFYNDQTDEFIRGKVHKYSNTMFIFGLILAIGTLIVLYYFSRQRVEYEIGAGVRTSPFGVQDYMPLLLFIFEIITGCFIWYVFRNISLRLLIYTNKRKLRFNKMKCIEYGEKAKSVLESARKRNLFDIMSRHGELSNSFILCNYRLNHRDPSNELDFFKIPQFETYFISFKVLNDNNETFDTLNSNYQSLVNENKSKLEDVEKRDGKGTSYDDQLKENQQKEMEASLKRNEIQKPNILFNVQFLTEFGKRGENIGSDLSDDKIIDFEVLTFPGDSVVELFIKKNASDYRTFSGTYKLSKEKRKSVHQIDYS